MFGQFGPLRKSPGESMGGACSIHAQALVMILVFGGLLFFPSGGPDSYWLTSALCGGVIDRVMDLRLA